MAWRRSFLQPRKVHLAVAYGSGQTSDQRQMRDYCIFQHSHNGCFSYDSTSSDAMGGTGLALGHGIGVKDQKKNK